jgi:hypothetical protein
LQKITDVIESDLSSELSKNDLNIFGELWKDHNVLAKAQQEGTAKFKDLENFKNKLINKWNDFYRNAKTALDAKHKSNPIEVTQKMVDDFEALNRLILGNEFLKPN